MIKKYTPNTKIIPGQWVNVEVVSIHGIAGRPARVKEVDGKTLTLEKIRVDSFNDIIVEGEFHQSADAMTFVSDSFEEAQMIFTKSNELSQFSLTRERDLKNEIETMGKNMGKLLEAVSIETIRKRMARSTA